MFAQKQTELLVSLDVTYRHALSTLPLAPPPPPPHPLEKC